MTIAKWTVLDGIDVSVERQIETKLRRLRKLAQQSGLALCPRGVERNGSLCWTYLAK